MQLFSKEDIQRAREMDLMTYLSVYEPHNLKHVSGNIYSTVEHDSLIINNGKWCWFSQGVGGRSALDYLIKVKGVPFLEAVQRIIGSAPEKITPVKVVPLCPVRELVLPEISDNATKAIEYLVGKISGV